eukprot:SAG31_NODE_1071_length_10069_cov_3.085356_1_plen_65_part_00
MLCTWHVHNIHNLLRELEEEREVVKAETAQKNSVQNEFVRERQQRMTAEENCYEIFILRWHFYN